MTKVATFFELRQDRDSALTGGCGQRTLVFLRLTCMPGSIASPMNLLLAIFVSRFHTAQWAGPEHAVIGILAVYICLLAVCAPPVKMCGVCLFWIYSENKLGFGSLGTI